MTSSDPLKCVLAVDMGSGRTAVHFAQEEGDEGPQASTVAIVGGKRHPASGPV